MAATVSCPHCDKPVDPQARYCSFCGVDLAMAAVAAERQVQFSNDLPSGIPLSPELLVPRLGDFLVEQGTISAEDLDKALAYQVSKIKAGAPVMLGQALRGLGLLDTETLDKAVTVQILRLQAALGQANRSLEHRVRERTLELQRAIQRLTELNQLKANFIANISHELRTPLTQIKGYLDILASGGLGELSADQLEALAIVQRANQRLERLIEDLIQFAVAARGELQLNLAVMSVRPVIQAAAEQAALKAQTSGVRLVVAAPGNLPPVRADEEKLGWVIQQLVDNALKFTPRGGQVRLEAAATPGLVTLTVSDTGIGIHAERLEEIFEPFHQLDGSMTRKYSGTGLGLALVKRIIEAHGSTVQVASRPGQGSRFEFSLAVAGQPVGASREAAS